MHHYSTKSNAGAKSAGPSNGAGTSAWCWTGGEREGTDSIAGRTLTWGKWKWKSEKRKKVERGAPTLLHGGKWKTTEGLTFFICLFLLNITVWIRRTYIYTICWRIQDGYIYHSAQGSQAEAETLLLLEVRRGPCLTFPVPCVCSYRKLQKLNLLFWFSLQSGEI